jgi:hypothetical protein
MTGSAHCGLAFALKQIDPVAALSAFGRDLDFPAALLAGAGTISNLGGGL